MTAFERLAFKVDDLEKLTRAAAQNEMLTRARVEAMEARLTMFESMPLKKRLTWLLRGR